jgi:phosphate transport system substrate-binding protein
MKVSLLAKSAAVALVFGLVASTPAHAVDLQGSGASFPALLIEACKAPFATSSGHSFTYAASGSGTGRSNSDKSIGDFWFTDAAHTSSAKRASIIHAPVVAAPIGILHNLPSRNTLSLSAPTIAGIFSGTITRWNDPAIVKDNNRAFNKVIYKTKNGAVVKDSKGDPVVARTIPTKTRYTLPNKPIKVVYRSDSSGTTENFTNYLNKSAPSVWTKAKAAVFTSSFPGNINSPENLGRIVGASSSTGVSQLAGKTPYSITFAEVNYAVANKLKVAHVINNVGNAVEPTSVATSAFLSQASIDNNGIMSFDYATKEAGAYTLGIVSYMLVDTNYADKSKAAAVKSLASFILSPACAKDRGEALGFSVLDGEFLKKAQSLVAKIG